MKKQSFCLATVFVISQLVCATTVAQSSLVDCLQTEAALEYWRPIRESILEDNYSANQLATELVSCLGSPNSELRDRIGYELITYWLRNDEFDLPTKRTLFQSLLANLQKTDSADSLNRSFSALILSELLRADDLSAFLSDEDRSVLLESTVVALANESDYRGLVEELGWIHPVAHQADILWRFALHSALSQEQAHNILEGVRSKSGISASSYGFNEGDRLARPVSVLIVREILTPAEIINWLSRFDLPTSMDDWIDAFASIGGMNELHNTKLFIRALSDQLQNESIDNGIREKLDELVAALTAIV